MLWPLGMSCNVDAPSASARPIGEIDCDRGMPVRAATRPTGVGFTEHSARITPTALVEYLNRLYR